jgi:sigma-B regulation protein RsbU (phosphoserine phosphatase)
MQKIAILYDASQAVLSTFDLDEVFEQILAIMRDYFHLETGAILLLDEKRQELRVRAYFGPQKLSGERVPVGTGIVGMAASKKLPIHVPDVTQDPRYVPLIASTRSELAVPLMLRDEVVGVLDCQSNQLDCFDSETLDLLTLFSTQASLALQNARLYSLEQRRAAQLEAINAIARQTHALLDLKQLLGRVCSLVLQSFPVDHVSVLLLEGGQLVQRAECGRLTPRFAAGDTVPLEAGLCARAVQSAKPALDNDVAKLPGYVAAFEETRSEM